MAFTKLAILVAAILSSTSLALPAPASPQQPLGDSASSKTNPYSPQYRDPYDRKVDAQGDDLEPLPWRNGDGASMLGPQNKGRQQQMPDMIRPPSTDHGTMKSMHWSYADSHMRIEEGGWTRQTTIRELPTSVELAGVNMRLGPGVIRELHWHKEAEWAYVLAGDVRVTAFDKDGGAFIDDLTEGDLWYFPSGHPHSLQGLGENGTEFLLVFDDGNFSEESTFLLTDWLAHTPKSVLSENFRVNPAIFKNIPKSEKYIFQGSIPGSIEDETPPAFKKSKLQFTHKMLKQDPKVTSGGKVRITDSTNFPLSKTVAASHLDIAPGAMREMHWHPNADEWSFFVKGRARVTIFAAEGNARTFNYQAGDVGVVPQNMGHYIENLSDEEPLEVLEIFRADEFMDFSLNRWLGETPARLVTDHLFAGDEEAGKEFMKEVESGEADLIKKKFEGMKGKTTVHEEI